MSEASKPLHAPSPAALTDADLAALKAILDSHDLACPHCDHNMRHGDPFRCSECGGHVLPTVSLSRLAVVPSDHGAYSRLFSIQLFLFVPALVHGLFAGIHATIMLLALLGGSPVEIANRNYFLHHAACAVALCCLASFWRRCGRAPGPRGRALPIIIGVLLIVGIVLSVIAPAVLGLDRLSMP